MIIKKGRYFITGTDTGVGKTFISGIICQKIGASYYKPIQSGSLFASDEEYIKSLGIKTISSTFVFKAPESPHIAAKKEGIKIDINKILNQSLPDNTIVEGAGGIFVPINDELLIIDLIQKLNLEVIVVARTALGTINHTIMTINEIKRRNIPFKAIVLNGTPNKETLDTIKHWLKIEDSAILQCNANSDLEMIL